MYTGTATCLSYLKAQFEVSKSSYIQGPKMNAIVHLWEWLSKSTSYQVTTSIQGCGGEDYENAAALSPSFSTL